MLCSDWFKKAGGDTGQEPECDMAELWRAEPGGGEKKGDAVNYAVVGFVMDVRSASLFLVLHPSSQVHCERYY